MSIDIDFHSACKADRNVAEAGVGVQLPSSAYSPASQIWDLISTTERYWLEIVLSYFHNLISYLLLTFYYNITCLPHELEEPYECEFWAIFIVISKFGLVATLPKY